MSERKEDGGSAYPTSNYDDGMTLRDYFAGQALSSFGPDELECDPKQNAKWAYCIADAMLEARK
jgi:hypothetical protein